MKRLCIIPARGGSKRFPGKNLAELNGKSLIMHAYTKAVNVFGRIIISSDNQKIIDKYYICSLVPSNPKLIVDKRPAKLATDTSKVIDTVSHYFDIYGKDFDQIWLLLPTCPLRTTEDIIKAQKLLTRDIDGIVSITDYEFPPTLGLEFEDGFIYDWQDSNPWQNGNTRSQDHRPIYRPNGAIYGMWCDSFGRYRNFYKGKIKGYYMPRERSVDIDTKFDLLVAEAILKENK